MEKFEIKYDNTLSEIEEGYKQFQRKYMLKRNILFSIVYAISAAVGIDLLVVKPNAMTGYILLAIGLGMLFSTWARPVYARKRLIKTLESFGEEKYSAIFSENKITVDTEIVSEEETETVAVTPYGVMPVNEDEEIPDDKLIKHEKTEIELKGNTLDSIETEKLFLLFLNRSLIYIFPKRCMTDEETARLHNYFEDKNI